MNKYKANALKAIDDKKELISETADSIWEFAELSMQEYKSCNLYCEILDKEGFEVEKGICNIPTAFSASFGAGRPVIGILAEYDALSGLSQEGGVTFKKEHVSGERDHGFAGAESSGDGESSRGENASGGNGHVLPGNGGESKVENVSGGNGHGCGHNLLGAGAMAAAIGLKNYLVESGHEGTVILYGCPGEEGVASKAFMARDGVWKKLDAALTWHPADCNEVVTGSSNSCIQVQYTFHGIASHASGAPDKGRSALDAVELMNIGVQFLREHMSDRARVHYAITDAGGVSPNVVQPRAQVLYMVRSNHVSEAVELQKRVDKIAEGAALMTETSFDRKFVDGLSDTVTNRALEEVVYKNFEEIGVPSYTEEELKYAEELAGTYEGHDEAPGIGSDFDVLYKDNALELRRDFLEKIGRAGGMNGFLLPHYKGDAFEPGSTDVGDVSWQCPTVQVHVAAWPNGCPGHSWQNVSCDRTDIGHKAAVHAGKVLCGAAIDLFEDEGALKAAREEFEKRTADGYVCPIPEDAVAEAIM